MANERVGLDNNVVWELHNGQFQELHRGVVGHWAYVVSFQFAHYGADCVRDSGAPSERDVCVNGFTQVLYLL